MKMRTLLTLSFVATGVFANAALDMDHINPVGTNLVPNNVYGIMQIFPDAPTFSGTVIDDFISSGTSVNKVEVAFELSNPNLNFSLITGWQVSVFSSVANAANSGGLLNLNTVSQTLATPGQAAISTLTGTGSTQEVRKASITGLNLAVNPTGHYWIGVAAVLPFSAGQLFIMEHLTPAVLGAGTSKDEWGIQPLDGFGGGTNFQMQGNAAYAVTTVPEPATLIALGAGLAAFARRRRSSK